MLSQFLAMVLIPLAINAAIIGVGHAVEEIWLPAGRTRSSLIFNIKHLVPYHALHAITVPPILGATLWATNAAGGGWLILPSNGPGLIWGIAVFTLAMDLGEYVFHFAQHKVPFLWALHSLHHSDRTLNVSTTQRHFWGDQILKMLTFYVIVGLLFRANPAIVTAYSIISLYNFFTHMNVKVGLGQFSWLINTPQYHRLHHSRRPKDFDLRYAAIFPIFDMFCGTYRRPETNDYPQTGLDEEAEPENLVAAILWPIRSRRKTSIGSEEQPAN